MSKTVIVIGGGASGIVAAIAAAQSDAKVTILERNNRIGKKILTTGNGRCNLTNVNANSNSYFGENIDVVENIFNMFSVQDTIDFFEDLGIMVKQEDFGKCYPNSDQASSILDVLMYRLQELNVKIQVDSKVKDIKKEENKFTVITEDNKKYTSDSVIIATGGNSMPSSGSDGNGYELAKKLGHKVTKVHPALVQLKLKGDFFKSIDGVKIYSRAEVMVDDNVVAGDVGDILFTNYGISGPPILQMSMYANELIEKGKKPFINVSILKDIDYNSAKLMLKERFSKNPNKDIDFSLVGLINKRLIIPILKICNIDIHKKVSKLTENEVSTLAKILTSWKMEIVGDKGWQSSQVTAGGVKVDQLNLYTLESKKIKGLYFTGEILDITGLCGGFNLQWAWSSGYVAGLNSAKEKKKK